MTTAACESRCQPSLLPRSLCVCACKGALHGTASAQLGMFVLPLPALAPPPEQLELECGAVAPSPAGTVTTAGEKGKA